MENNSPRWWERPLRVIQTNLQVRDTGRIEPQRLAAQIKAMNANTLVFNVGGIYAWYPTEVPFHTRNEYLPRDRDLLGEVIDACHEQEIRFIARFDFSKADDSIYQRKPHWFMRDAKREPEIIGLRRPGPWSLLMTTCPNGEYRNEAVAIPVLEEVMERYPIDGIFFNNPMYFPCHCGYCQRLYRERYGEEMPDDALRFQPDWGDYCMRTNMERLYRAIKRKNPDMPMVLYYDLFNDRVTDRFETSDLQCSEPQNILSRGHKDIPEYWRPVLGIKLGHFLGARPFGIVHSCPGMEWRHTGLPVAEYQFWLSQIPAHGGQLWHSLTGVSDTITDKRILRTVTEINAMAARAENAMEGARSCAEVALLWHKQRSAEGWAEGLLQKQIPFDVVLEDRLDAKRLQGYRVLIIPEGYPYSEPLVRLLNDYVRQGGGLILEGEIPHRFPGLFALAGIRPGLVPSEPLAASYFRFEGDDHPLRRGLEETELLAHRGTVWYCEPEPATRVLATLVPPFSPLDGVGAPPERASMSVSRTDIPLCCLHRYEAGQAAYFPTSFSHLLYEFRLEEHLVLLSNLIDTLMGGKRPVRVTNVQGLQLAAFCKENQLIVNLVNGAGRRPLTTTIPLRQLILEIDLRPGQSVERVMHLISGAEPRYAVEGRTLKIEVPELNVWESVLITFGQGESDHEQPCAG